MLEFESLEVFQTEPDVTIASWVLRMTNEDLTGLEFVVSRSHAQHEDFEEVGRVPYPQRYFVDRSGDRFDHWRKAYYRVSASFQGRTFEKGPETIGSDLFPMSREMIRRIGIDLRFSGIPVMVYLKRKGERCPDCWDPHLKKATRSSCSTCFATSFVGGYHDPILTLANKVPEVKRDQPDVTKRQNAQTILKMSVFPVLRPNDILYHVNTPDRWRIVSIQPEVVHDNLVGQEQIVVAKLNPTDVEHSLPIPKGLSYVIQPHWEEDIRARRNKVAHSDGEVEIVPLWRPGT
jgi:hypothetical protein